MGNAITIKSINFSYSNNLGSQIFDNFSLDIKEGEIVTVLGKSGCGKTTLLNIIIGNLTPQNGVVDIESKTKVAFSSMPQISNFIPFRTAFENATLPLELNNEVTPNTLSKLNQLFIEFGLFNFKNKFPNELSGGMKQRLGLIQNFATNTSLRLLDEPLNALDYNSVLTITDILWKKLKENNETGVFVTHDIEFAVSISDRLIVLKHNSDFTEIQLDLEVSQTIPSLRKNIEAFKEISNKVVNELLI